LSRSRPRRPALSLVGRFGRGASVLALLAVGGCTETLDAGHSRQHGMLPVDERNPVILYQDDWSGDWLGEYAMLLANSGGPPLAGIVVNASRFWPILSQNASGWKDEIAAARASGLKNIPAVTASAGTQLARPLNGDIDATRPNHSAGAQLIVDVSRQLSTPWRPVVVVSATSLTDIADAYLLDHTVVDRVVVVAALGIFVEPNGTMGGPNGDMDPWADWIVTQRFRYVQVSVYYDQVGDVTMSQLSSLPLNALGNWISRKVPNIIKVPTASDQIALLAVALPRFVVGVTRASPDISTGFDPMQGPLLVPDPHGNAWVVTQIAGPLAAARLWQMLLDPHTFGS
jgi:hypothetical protein